MNVTVRRVTEWSDALDRARMTAGKPAIHREPSSEWKRKMLLCRHSPIRTVMYDIVFTDLKSWVSVHLVRHSKFAEHFVSSQRPDRTGAENQDRDSYPQGAKVTHQIFTNAAELIEISKKRLCSLASKETREAWEAVVRELRAAGEVEMADAMVPECWHNGGMCPELKGCGRCQSIWENECSRRTGSTGKAVTEDVEDPMPRDRGMRLNALERRPR